VTLLVEKSQVGFKRWIGRVFLGRAIRASDVHFAVVILSPLKALFSTMDLDSDYLLIPDVKT
jgi:hypothetical protein